MLSPCLSDLHLCTCDKIFAFTCIYLSMFPENRRRAHRAPLPKICGMRGQSLEHPHGYRFYDLGSISIPYYNRCRPFRISTHYPESGGRNSPLLTNDKLSEPRRLAADCTGIPILRTYPEAKVSGFACAQCSQRFKPFANRLLCPNKVIQAVGESATVPSPGSVRPLVGPQGSATSSVVAQHSGGFVVGSGANRRRGSILAFPPEDFLATELAPDTPVRVVRALRPRREIDPHSSEDLIQTLDLTRKAGW